MIKKFLRSIIGSEFPPKHARLCHQCRTAYTVAGIFNPWKPPLGFGKIEDLLHSFALLCPKPCGALSSKPMQPRIGFRLREFFRESGMKCHDCRIATLTMITIVNVMTATYKTFISTPSLTGETHLLKEKNLICNECLHVFEDLMSG